MATVAAPRKRRNRRRWWLIGGGILALIVIGAIVMQLMRPAQPVTDTVPGWTKATASKGTIDASISASGTVAPQAQAEVRFVAEGPVVEVLVKPGDAVSSGQALARVDATDAQLRLESAQADLEQAQASLTDLEDGPTESEVKAAQSRVAQAKAQYDQTLAQVSNADVTAAKARLEQAQARYAQLRAGPKDVDMRDAQAALERAKAGLQSDRDRLSANKTNAQIALDTAVADLTRAQNSYSTALQNWQFVQDTGADPTNPEVSDPSQPGKKVKNKLNDTQRQQYYDAFVSAEAALRQAELAVERAKVEFDAARQAEATGVQTSEQQLVSAQASYDKLTAGADRDALAEARAAVASAQAELNRLVGSSRASDLAAAQANLEAAQFDLEKLSDGPTELERTRAQADLARATTAAKQAQRSIDQATLKAPFDATVARVDLRVGELAGATGTIALVDMRSFHVDAPVDELDVAQIAPGLTVRVQMDALPTAVLTGTVRTVSPLAVKNERGANTYQVTVDLDGADPGVKPGMSAALQIVTLRKDGVVLIPRRAVQTENGETFVYVPGTPAPPPAGSGGFGAAPAVAPGAKRTVKLGLSNSESVEVISGLTEGETIYVPDIVQTFNPTVQ
jgi:HlyD family secretion protein